MSEKQERVAVIRQLKNSSGFLMSMFNYQPVSLLGEIMNKAIIFGGFTALLGLIWFIYVLTVGSSAPVLQLPYEAFQGLVFFLAWGVGFPVTLAYVASGLCMLAVPVLGFVIGYKLWGWIFGKK